MSALTDYFTSLANKIRSKTGSASTMTPTQMVGAVDDVYSAGQSNPPTQEKTAPNQSYSDILTVTPDSGKYLSKVNIPKAFGGDATTLASSSMKTVTAASGGAIKFSESNLSKGLYIAILPWFSQGSASRPENNCVNVNKIGSITTGTIARTGAIASIDAIVLESLGNGLFDMRYSEGGVQSSSNVNWFLIKVSD